ncbi:hypothetical protein CFP71_27075 [Amycolatopsis thailandensis]|uniref:Uncharacterized protein n=1 Tax=Amycolatopsis thailandensis TaxID=589330 RepID=A0A229RVQ7_9PSEU|nr:hypothetical protein CFP71_27075 [Amycolatopsis thailandensis]
MVLNAGVPLRWVHDGDRSVDETEDRIRQGIEKCGDGRSLVNFDMQISAFATSPDVHGVRTADKAEPT